MNTARLAALVGMTALIVSGCGSSTPGSGANTSTSPTTTARPSIAISVSPAPQQRNNNGRPAVAFDPCTDLGDAAIQKLGFDPTTRTRNDLIADTYTFLGCDFKEKNADGATTWTLGIKATNIPLSEFRSRYSDTIQNFTAAGRQAMTYLLTKSSTADTCFVAMDSPAGVINLQLDVDWTRTTGQPCERIRDIAEKLQPELPTK
ncbi:hypothetical protein CRH09_11760 [Nocardia terpenica]|uniref:DUF3558 domain-containing protein n=2 Tax=Nocardia terpenica TaxID=455432 RepID=A0A291RI78_9NOCA|nr:hypothetical protein CRH09_11760 [Nocardia terpenica]